jgi:putative heme iron utilization protein
MATNGHELPEAALRRTEAAYRAAADHAEACRIERNLAVLDALAAGMTQRQVGHITGLSRARINQIQQDAKGQVKS